MADKDLTVKTESKAKRKKPNFFARAGRGIARFFREHWSECKKIMWPNFRTVAKNTFVVFVIVFAIGLGIWICDFGVSELLKVLRAALGA